MSLRRIALAAFWAGAAALATASVAAPSHADTPNGYRAPGYTYTTPPNNNQPPGYTYTPPGYYRPQYRANTPDYNNAYDYPQSAYGDPRALRQERRRFGDPVYNRFGNPRNPADVWNSAPPYQSPGNQ